MNISGINITNAAKVTTELNLNREKEKVESFQSVLENAVESNDKVELKKACTAFEGYFVQMMFKEMRKTVNTQDGIFPKSQAEEIYQDMLDEEYSNSATDAGGIGIASMMYKQLSENIPDS